MDETVYILDRTLVTELESKKEGLNLTNKMYRQSSELVEFKRPVILHCWFYQYFVLRMSMHIMLIRGLKNISVRCYTHNTFFSLV